MTGRTHDAVAFASLVTAGILYPPEAISLTTLVVCVIGADIGALLPDIDQAGNRLWEMLPAGDRVGKVLRRLFYKHRTLTHSLIGLFGIYKLLEFALPKLLNSGFVDTNLVIASIMIGYVSHLVADSFTEDGLPLFFPINFTFGIPPIRKVRIKTGKWFENLVVYPSIWIFVLWLVNEKKDTLIKILKLVS